MGLIDLKTDLKSLRYGRDRKGGGSSNQPYVTTPIPDDLTANGPDFLLRQGALQASLDDVSRLTKWFLDPLSVNGALFTAKQELLERQNIPVNGTPNRIYSPLSTISQAGLNAVGGHLNKRGLNPFELGYYTLGTDSNGYFKFTLNVNNLNNPNNSIYPEGDGKLTTLYKVNFAPFSPEIFNFGNETYGISSQPGILLTYNGGPNSLLGLGKTNIRIQNPTVRTYINRDGSNPNDVYTFQSEDFAKQVQRTTVGLNSITDYRVTINKAVGDQVLPATVYEEFNRERTYKTSATYYKVLNKKALFIPNNSISVDEINALDVQTTNTAQGEEENNNQAITNIINYSDSDLIKFFFEVINPNTVESVDYLFFRAYINSIGDNFKGEWQPYRYLGRAESFYKYGGFSRDVQLSFTIYAHSRAEMKPLYNKLNRLVGTTSPRYSGGGYMLGNFVRLTVGTYFSNVPGIINNISLKPSFEAGWDINRNTEGLSFKPEDEDNYLGQVPRMIEVDLSFTPIHDFAPKYGEIFINNEPVELTPPTPSPAVTPNSIDTPTSTPPPPPPPPPPINFANPVTSNLNQILNPGLGSGVLFP